MKGLSIVILCAVLMIDAQAQLVTASAAGAQADISIFALPDPVGINANRKTGSPHWYYTLRFQETNGVGLEVGSIRRYLRMKDSMVLDAQYDAETIASWFGSARIEAYGILDFSSGRPAQAGTEGETWEITGMDDNRNAVQFSCDMAFSPDPPTETHADPRHDTQNLRSKADFEVSVAQGVWWVPAVSLGGTRMTGTEIKALLHLSPEKKQDAINTLYEALQLYQISAFRDAEDKIYMEEEGILWEHHKPGFDAVRTNEGCCATNSNWLQYILQGDYDQTGFLSYSQADSSGHVLNYIRRGSFWYFIDLTHYRVDFLSKSSIETGNADDYLASDFVAGNLHKADSPLSYIMYCLGAFNDPPGLFFLYTAEDCLPVASAESHGTTMIIYPKRSDITIVYDNPKDHLAWRFADPSADVPDWSVFTSAF